MNVGKMHITKTDWGKSCFEAKMHFTARQLVSLPMEVTEMERQSLETCRNVNFNSLKLGLEFQSL